MSVANRPAYGPAFVGSVPLTGSIDQSEIFKWSLVARPPHCRLGALIEKPIINVAVSDRQLQTGRPASASK